MQKWSEVYFLQNQTRSAKIKRSGFLQNQTRSAKIERSGFLQNQIRSAKIKRNGFLHKTKPEVQKLSAAVFCKTKSGVQKLSAAVFCKTKPGVQKLSEAVFCKNLFSLYIFALGLLFTCSCDTYTTRYKERAEKAALSQGDIVVGIVDSSVPPSFFVRGVQLAIDELNEDGGVLGRRIRPIFYDDDASLEKGLNIAEELSENTDVVAVVGHIDSRTAISASVSYEENGILFISPGATDQDLIREDSALTFRNIPSEKDIAHEMAEFAFRNRHMKMAVVYDSETHGKRMAEIFHEHADSLGIGIVAEKSYSAWDDDHRFLIADLISEGEFGAVFLGGVLPSAGNMIRQMRDMGIMVPIIGTGSLDSLELWNIAGKGSQETIVPTVFDPRQPRSLTRNFVKKFTSHFSFEPDTWAAQGYDAIRVLASAIEAGGSAVPIVISTTLRFMNKWEGVTSAYSFQRNGNITGKSVFFKVIREGSFEFLERELRKDIHLFEVLEDITLRLPMEGAVTTIDPGITVDTTSIEITEQLFLGLTDLNPETYEAVPELAEDWTVSEDGMTYRFNLRPDVVWTDGAPVTAHDIVWAVRRNISPDTKSPSAFMLNILKNAMAITKGEKDPSEIGVHTAGDFTVVFELENPAAYFPAMAGLWVYRPLPRYVIEKHKDRWTLPENIQTNGSYKLAAWEKGMVMILRKNPAYYDAEHVSIPEVRYYIIPESSIGLAMYENNQLDIIGDAYLRIPIAEIPNMPTSTLSAEYSQVPLFCTYAYAFNTRLPPVDNPLVRKAISAAIDRKLLIRLVTRGNQEIAHTFTRPPIFGSVDSGQEVGIPFDPDRAKKWLAQAGYPDGKGFPEISMLYNESETHEKVAEAVQIFLKHYLNIAIRLEPMEFSEYLKARSEHLPGHMIRFGWCSDYPDANNWLNDLFHPTMSDNIVGWDNPVFAELMEQAQKAQNPRLRKRLYKHAEEILCEEVCAVVPIYFETAHYLVKPRVKGWYSMAMGGQHIRNWYFEE
ncbi:MAG: hypothetical protein B6245_08805 [Desulfobacteraceae bacterium 4572_88]|nr:MAG: hypothetical protein B6245_08805 [Desulfobacteraceae bacterium 4572_88]